MITRVDFASRLIFGVAVPYGRSARIQARHRSFAPGFWRPQPGRLWLCIEHSQSARAGEIQSLTETAAGLTCVARVRPGAAGDRILIMADQRRYGFSIGFDVITEIPDGVAAGRLVTRAKLNEISLTRDPAFGGVEHAGQRDHVHR